MKHTIQHLRLPLTLSAVLVLSVACASKPQLNQPSSYATTMSAVDSYTLKGDKHLVRDYSPVSTTGDINVVIEIPTGTNAKWEADKSSGALIWEFKNDKPRVVSYLGYPGNYGMIPQTLLSKELGGDGDPLDVLVLGPAIPRGSVVPVRPIGVLKLLDGGEQDDKIVAVSLDSKLGHINSIEALQREYNGITDIVEIWFENYKGPGEIESNGFASVAASEAVIKASIDAYKANIM